MLYFLFHFLLCSVFISVGCLTDGFRWVWLIFYVSLSIGVSNVASMCPYIVALFVNERLYVFHLVANMCNKLNKCRLFVFGVGGRVLELRCWNGNAKSSLWYNMWIYVRMCVCVCDYFLFFFFCLCLVCARSNRKDIQIGRVMEDIYICRGGKCY